MCVYSLASGWEVACSTCARAYVTNMHVCVCVCVLAGVPFWIVKNEWSAHWGDGGFIKVAQDNDCGIATEAFFVIANSKMT